MTEIEGFDVVEIDTDEEEERDARDAERLAEGVYVGDTEELAEFEDSAEWDESELCERLNRELRDDKIDNV